MIFSTIAENILNKIQHAFLIKPLSKLEREGESLYLIKGIYEKIHLTSHLIVKDLMFSSLYQE